jgi:hypothetical protein
MKAKAFDCVQMKRGGAMKIQRKLAGKTREEQIEYWHKRTEELRARQATLRKAQGVPGGAK